MTNLIDQRADAAQDACEHIRCRLIGEADAAALSELLARGFPDRPASYWLRAFDTLARRDAPPGYPRFGYLLENNGVPIGAMLMIFTRLGAAHIRCHVSTWHVEEAFRAYASLLISAAVRHKDVTYINASPATHALPVFEAQGFRRYCAGQMLTLPAFGRWASNTRARPFDPRRDYGDALSPEERSILISHVAHGCLAIVVHEKRDAHPFVFLPRRALKGLFPTLQLAYCRRLSDFQRFAGPIGRALLEKGHPTVMIDASEAVPGLVGVFLRSGPKYFKGPERPRFGDLAFSEAVLFGP